MRSLKKAVETTNIKMPLIGGIPTEYIHQLYDKVSSDPIFASSLKDCTIPDVTDMATMLCDLVSKDRDWTCSRVQMSTELLYRAMLKNGFIEEE